MSGTFAITGVGGVTAAGEGFEAAIRVFTEPLPRLTTIKRSTAYHRGAGSDSAALATGFEPGRWLSPELMRRMSRPSLLAVSAAKMAVTDAGLEPTDLAGPETAVVMATSYGPCAFTERLLLKIYETGPDSASPLLFTESVANAAAAQIALALGARGANVTVTQREAGLVIALARGARELGLERADRVIVGVVEEMTPLLHAVLERFGALSRCREEGREIARPFDLRRSGFLAADGSVTALIEPAASAVARGARVRAYLRPLGSTFDPDAPPTGWSSDPATLARALERMLKHAEIEVGSIDRIVAGASGAKAHDRLEGLVLRRVWGTRSLPPILAPKAHLGEHGGAQLLAAVAAVAGASFAPTPGFGEPDPEIGVEPHRGGELKAASRVLVSSLATGGAAAWTLVQKGPDAN